MTNFGAHDPETGLRTGDGLLRSLDTIIQTAIEKGRLVIFAGDAYRSPRLSTPDGAAAERLSYAGIPTILVTGNHDIALDTNHQRFDTLAPEHITVINKPLRTKDLENLPVQVLGIPGSRARG